MHIGMNYIDGTWTPFRPDFQSIAPATENELGLFPQSTPAEVIEAVQAAKTAQKKWKQISRVKRGEYFDKLCQIMKRDTPFLVEAITKETGKGENESLAEVTESLHMVQYVFGKSKMPVGEINPSEIPEKDCFSIRKPKGVVGVISPWNFPYNIGAFWGAAPAILEGNTVVFKPSEDTPMVAQMAVSQYVEAGFPAGVINLLHGNGKVGEELVYNDDVNHYCFTGSYKVGQFIRQICAIQGNKTCSLEMGSKSAVVVCADAQMDLAIKACVASAYKLSGQRCVSASRILVEESIFEEFSNKFVEESKKVDLGPLINKDQLDRVISYNELANTDVLLAGKKCGTSGFFVSPHVYKANWQFPEERKFLVEEVFGPHIALIPFKDLDEAIKIYNDTEYGLAFSIITNDYRKMRKAREEADFGLGYVNLPCIGAESQMLFGGVKNSGYGGSSAAGTFDAVVNKVTWTVNCGADIKMAQGLK
jgi:aldehyde dehydrogenase (NAD+)